MADLKYIGKNILNHDLTLKKGNVSGSNASTGSFGHLIISDNASITGDLVVDGKLTAQEIHTEIESASIIFSSGSTLFGNTQDDTHTFTGSLKVTGSVTALNLTADSSSFSTRITNLKTDSGSFSTRITADSSSFSARVTTAEIELENTIISASAQISSRISGSFTAPSASLSARTTTLEGTGTVQGVGTGDNVIFNRITGSGMRIGGGSSKFSLTDSTPNGTANTVFGDAQFGSTSTTNTGITLFGTGQVGIAFGDASSELSGQIRYQHSTDEFEIYTGGAERLMIDSDGINVTGHVTCLLYTSPSPRDRG